MILLQEIGVLSEERELTGCDFLRIVRIGRQYKPDEDRCADPITEGLIWLVYLAYWLMWNRYVFWKEDRTRLYKSLIQLIGNAYESDHINSSHKPVSIFPMKRLNYQDWHIPCPSTKTVNG